MVHVRNTPGMPRPGDRIAGKYRIEKVIGAGGMGCVLAAEHALLRTHVAIKLLLPQAAALPGAAERFLREAQAAGALRGEHVARVLDMGMTEDGAPFLVMEHLTGQDLRRVIRDRAPLPVAEAVGYLLQTCEAILEAHALGILHRDIKPANIFLTSRPNGTPLVKVLDFGLAKVLAPADGDAPEESITETGQVIGSPHYMPPEQFRSLRNADIRSDIWALGVVLYELLTGKRPFVGEGMAGVMTSVIADQPASARSLRPDLPADLDALVMKCLEKSPERRPQWVAELVADLEPFASPQERASIAGSDLPAPVSETLTVPVKPQPTPEDLVPPVTPLFEASTGLPPSPAPPVKAAASELPLLPSGLGQPVMPPLAGRSTWRIVPSKPTSAADDLTGALIPENLSAVDAMSVHEPVRVDGITDLSQAATHPRPSSSWAMARSRWIVAACVLAVIAAGGIGARMLASDSPDKPASDQGTFPPPSNALTPQQPVTPAATASLDALPAGAPAAASTGLQAVPNGSSSSSRAVHPAPPPPSPKASESSPQVALGPAASVIYPWATSPSAAAARTPIASSGASPTVSSSKPATNPAPTVSDPFSKYK